jgi:hypothetical protein
MPHSIHSALTAAAALLILPLTGFSTGIQNQQPANPSYPQNTPDQQPAQPETPDQQNNGQDQNSRDTGDDIPNPDNANNGSPKGPSLPVPFGLQWGQGPEEILQWATNRQFQTAWKANAQAQGTESVLDVLPPTGTDQFPDAQFNDLNFAFKNGHLIEISLIFRYKDPNQTQADAIAQERKTVIDKGENQNGQLVQNNHSNKKGVDYKNRLWQWEKAPGLYIYLIVAEARQKDKSLVSVTQTYRNQNLAGTLANQPR